MQVLKRSVPTGLGSAVRLGVVRAVLFALPLAITVVVLGRAPLHIVVEHQPSRLQAWQRLCPGRDAAGHAVIRVDGHPRLVPFDRGWAVYRGERPGVFLGSCAKPAEASSRP